MNNLKESILENLKGYEIIKFPEISLNETKKEIGKKYITVKCQKCGEIFDVSIRNIFREYQTESVLCKKCRIEKRYKTEYKKLVEKLDSQDLEPITKMEDYKGFKNLFTVKCKKCNKIFNIKLDQQIYFCSCKQNRKNKTEERVIKNFNKKYSNFSLVEYNMETRVGKILDKTCNRIFEEKLLNFYKHPRCQLCYQENLLKKSFKNLEKQMSLRCPGFKLISFDGVWKHDITVRHSCGHEFKIKPENLLLRNRCPECDKNLSVGAKTIETYLKKHKIPFKKEKSFSELKDKYVLRFDFDIFMPNKIDRFCLIEFDGIQHFSTEKGFFGSSINQSQESLEYIQRHDLLKDNFCKKNNINLLRIRYDDNILSKLDTLFNDYPMEIEISQQE